MYLISYFGLYQIHFRLDPTTIAVLFHIVPNLKLKHLSYEGMSSSFLADKRPRSLLLSIESRLSPLDIFHCVTTEYT